MYERNQVNENNDPVEQRSGPSAALIGLVVLAILAVLFVVQNGEKTDITFLFTDVTASVWVAIAISIAIGIVLDRLFGIWWRRRRN